MELEHIKWAAFWDELQKIGAMPPPIPAAARKSLRYVFGGAAPGAVKATAAKPGVVAGALGGAAKGVKAAPPLPAAIRRGVPVGAVPVGPNPAGINWVPRGHTMQSAIGPTIRL